MLQSSGFTGSASIRPAGSCSGAVRWPGVRTVLAAALQLLDVLCGLAGLFRQLFNLLWLNTLVIAWPLHAPLPPCPRNVLYVDTDIHRSAPPHSSLSVAMLSCIPLAACSTWTSTTAILAPPHPATIGNNTPAFLPSSLLQRTLLGH